MANIQKYRKPDFERDQRVLELLSQTFPNISAASTEIINLEAILNLPKGTEHFVADLHGEYEAFGHTLRNASGNIKRKASELFGSTMRDSEIKELCSLIYYPKPKLELVKETESDLGDFYKITLNQLVKMVRSVSSKYTRSKVRKALPKEYAYIIEELLHETPDDTKKTAYFNRIIETIILTGRAEDFIVAMCNVIQRLSIDQLHVLGDIYDRGPGAHLIMDLLAGYPNFDIQWGNHDIVWMGAAAGNACCISNVLRMSLRYANMTTLEDGYGINLVPLVTFAMETYKDDPCERFVPKLDGSESDGYSHRDLQLLAKMHKAISVIQFKLEGAMAQKHPDWGMNDRCLLHLVDKAAKTIDLPDGKYELVDANFPTLDPARPYELTSEEEDIVNKLVHSFLVSDKLQSHMRVLISHGAIYGVYNGNLLYHASIPLNENGSLKEVSVAGEKLSGKRLMEKVNSVVRAAFNDDVDAEERGFAVDYFWYLWCGPDSPLFDKSKMATFERYFIADPATYKEVKGSYYTLRENPDVCDMILDEFGVKGTHRHIINGHVPVRAGNGENPIKAGAN